MISHRPPSFILLFFLFFFCLPVYEPGWHDVHAVWPSPADVGCVPAGHLSHSVNPI
jgi:hypothetical protein